MTGEAARSLLRSLTDLPPGGTVRPVGEVLVDLGWVPGKESAAGGWREWRSGGCLAYASEQGGRSSIEVVTKIAWPEEGRDRGGLYGVFEGEFDDTVVEVSEEYGSPGYTSRFGEPSVPVAGQFDRVAVWQRASWTVMVSFQQEDKEAPLRVSVWVVQS